MRNPGLDLLRFVAIGLVILRHIHIPDNLSGAGSIILRTIERGGWIGVDLFFVLSGFLVSSLLFREHKKTGLVDIRRFLIRRAFKIYPAFWFFIAVSLLVQIRLKNFPTSFEIVAELLFFQNYFQGIWNHTWSLAVEEHFYIGLAAIVFWLTRGSNPNPFTNLPSYFFVVASSCLILRIVTAVFVVPYDHRTHVFPTHLRIDSLMFGVLISYYWTYNELENRLQRISTVTLTSVGVLLLLPAFIFQLSAWVAAFGVVSFYFASGLLLCASLRLKETRSTVLKVLCELGSASYSIYLWHIAVANWGYTVIAKISGIDEYPLYFLNAVFGAITFGWIMNKVLENPLLKIRDKLFKGSVKPLSSI